MKLASLLSARASLILATLGWSFFVLILYFFRNYRSLTSESSLFFMWVVGVIGINAYFRLKTKTIDNSEDFQINDLFYSSVVETSPDSVVVTDLTGRFIFCSNQTAQMHGYNSPKDLVGKSAFIMFPFKEIIKATKYMRLTREGGMIKNVEFNLLRKDGSLFPAELSASLVTNKSGLPIAFIAIVRDITERKLVEAQVLESERLYRIIADNTYGWEFYQLPSGRFVYISPSCEKISGYDVVEFTRNPNLMESIIHPDDQAKYASHLHEEKHDLSTKEIDFRIIKPDGSIRWIDHICQPVYNKAGQFTGIRGSNRDITEKKALDNELLNAYEKLRTQYHEIEKLHDILREQTIRDPLTGLHNRRYMEEALKQEYSRALREKQSFSIVMLDMDNLKQINDNFGHVIGDKSLQMLSAELQKETRMEDITCRYGGDEFLVILHNTTAEDTFKKIDAIRQKICDHVMEFEGDEIPVTFTAGIATFPSDGKTMENVLQAADNALYAAKSNGRNCVIQYRQIVK